VHQVPKLVPDLLVVEDGRDHLSNLTSLERRERNQLRGAGTTPRLQQRKEGMPPVELVTAIRDEEERAHLGQPAGEVVEQLSRRRIRPVNVLDDQQEAVLARRDGEKRDDSLEQTQLRLPRITDGAREFLATELRKQLRQLAPRGAEQSRKLLAVLNGQIIAERLDEREIRDRELRFAAPTPQNLPIETLRPLGQLLREPRLSHSGLTAERDEAALTAMRREQRVFDGEELLVSPHERRAEGAFQHELIVTSAPPRNRASAANPHGFFYCGRARHMGLTSG
jgi:hypothetical protein